MKLVARLLVVGMLLPMITFQEVAASHFNQSAQYRSEASQQMSPEGKFIASTAVGVGVGVVAAKVLEKSTQMGSLLGAVAALYCFYLLRQSRESAVAEAVGREYVGVSAIAAIATAMVIHNPQAR